MLAFITPNAAGAAQAPAEGRPISVVSAGVFIGMAARSVDGRATFPIADSCGTPNAGPLTSSGAKAPVALRVKAPFSASRAPIPAAPTRRGPEAVATLGAAYVRARGSTRLGYYAQVPGRVRGATGPSRLGALAALRSEGF